MFREVSLDRQRIEEQVGVITVEDQSGDEVSAHPRHAEALGRIVGREIRIVDMVGDQGPPRAFVHIVDPVDEFMLKKPA